eukprot:1908819-Pyramimonas_sp.AAC.1
MVTAADTSRAENKQTMYTVVYNPDSRSAILSHMTSPRTGLTSRPSPIRSSVRYDTLAHARRPRTSPRRTSRL